MGARFYAVAALAVGAVALTGCSSTVSGDAVPEPGTPVTETVTAAPTPSSTAPPSSRATSVPIAIPDNGNGYTFMQTKSGKARCRVSTTGAGCQLEFDKPGPKTETGDRANGVNVGRDGTLTYVLGDIGVVNPATLDYATYTARGWTIEASFEGTRFTNNGTGHGMFVSTTGARAF
ncbi:Putative lipoprotein OS=Tsukamurella paurometabola (strain ATCC 8368 / DSM / CCUG 35730 / CIP 100753 / JCM 10117 / KCTC 9821 / NBRC 16120 / NCIMB 702349/ NCTC 13040) OX=521096 GN=Tpau_1452 PE=4 SV=1 [Tsukamurella paurometabola]|uniref:Putative lipoprotein n=1 Tax=Tsukamurella paurometabola (strain ATCC 8368 / DSM 20162 / CCUG 35730 / CIP 100753 / JCM 10117 / KCTC 9821 / NBRC 16120 / NCIMB 702349 / NCTC 13040) TaxID=521096 RepID=D5UXI7_TSUPD|nr:hypothetical protein [Tsukamurella paurometabola]ADG78079.1 putative lipoprotein [Tsukamurella paurometabola DSM 20162]SUP30088.1 Uncharacterised protein [Tsukamurella paurometabola]